MKEEDRLTQLEEKLNSMSLKHPEGDKTTESQGAQ